MIYKLTKNMIFEIKTNSSFICTYFFPSRMHSEIEILKTEARNKDEEQSRVRQRWRKEAEDALRNLKTNYKDVLAQKRLLEKQLEEVDEEKENLRSKNDRLEKDLADTQANVASEKRSMQLNMKEQDSPVQISSDLGHKEIARLLSHDMQSVRKENSKLVEILTSRDEAVKILKSKLLESEEVLQKEMNSNEELKCEISSLKGNSKLFMM